MANWPANLPNPLISEYGIEPVDPTIRTDMEKGAVRSRRRTAAKNDHFPAEWNMSNAQFVEFREWFDDPGGADGGAGWFQIDLLTGMDEDFVNVNARFFGIWQAVYVAHKRWHITAVLEILHA